MTFPTAYPLAWPSAAPRAKYRERGVYRTTLAGALKNLHREVTLLAGTAAGRTMILSSNVTLGQENPSDPGVVAYFIHDGDAVALPCDRWTTVAANVQAIALTIECMRGMQRHGSKHLIKAMFSGLVALPAPEGWRAVLELGADDGLAQAEQAFKRLAQKAHPDLPGGSHDAMARLNRAIDQARKELKHG